MSTHTIDYLKFYRRRIWLPLFCKVTLYLTTYVTRNCKIPENLCFSHQNVGLSKYKTCFFIINNIYSVLLGYLCLWCDRKSVKALIGLVFSTIISYLFYRRLKNVLLQMETYLSQNSECSRWPIRTFAECISIPYMLQGRNLMFKQLPLDLANVTAW